MSTRFIEGFSGCFCSDSLGGCDGITGPDRTGTIDLSSEKFSPGEWYLFGYSYEVGEYHRYPYQGEPEPDIINEGYLVLKEGEVTYCQDSIHPDS